MSTEPKVDEGAQKLRSRRTVKVERLPGTKLITVRDRMRTPKQETDQETFLRVYEDLGNIDRTCRETKIPESRHRYWLHNDYEYNQRFQLCRERAIRRMKEEAYRRAVSGVKKNVYQLGRHVGTITEYSDNLLMFLLKGACPEEFRENYKAEPARKSYPDPDYSALSTEELKTLHALALKVRQSRGPGDRTLEPGKEPDPDVFQ